MILKLALSAASALAGFSAAQSISQPRLHVLGNGMRVLTVEDHSSPLITTTWGVRAGASTELPGFRGSSHFLEHLVLFRGSAKFGPNAISSRVTGQGGFFNGYTWEDCTLYVTMLPSGRADDLLEIAEEMMFHASFKDKEFEAEKSAVLEEMRLRQDTPMGYLWDAVPYELYPAESFYSRSVIGNTETVRSAKYEAVRRYYEEYYVPNNMTLAVVGDFDTMELLAKIENRFARYPAKPVPASLYAPLGLRPGIVFSQEERDVQKSYFFMAFETPVSTSPDYLPLLLLSSYLTGGKTSLLRDKLITEAKLLTNVDHLALRRSHPGGWQLIRGEAAPDKLGDGVDGIFSELARLAAGNIDAAAVESARRRLVNAQALRKDDQGEVSQRLADFDCVGSYTLFSNLEENLAKVSLQDLQTVARKYLRPDHFYLKVLAPRGKADSGLRERILAMAGKHRASEEALVLSKEVGNGSAFLHEARPGSTTESFTVAVRAGSRFDSGKPGLANGVLSALTRRTARRDRFALQKALDENGLLLTSSIERDAAFITLRGPAGKSREALSLLREIAAPRPVPEQEWEPLKKELSAGASRLRDDPEWVAENGAFERLFAPHPYGHPPQGRPETIEKITTADLTAFAASRYAPENMALAYSGPETASAIEAEWAKLPAVKRRKEAPDSELSSPRMTGAFSIDLPGRSQANLFMAWPAPKVASKEWVFWQLGQQALGGDWAGRLWLLRQKEELAYAVDAESFPTADQPVAAIVMGTALDKKKRAVAALNREVEAISSKGISQEELDRVKASYLGRLDRFDRTTERRSQRLASWWILGLPASYRADLRKQVAAATLDEVNRTVRRVLDPEKRLLISVEPATP